MSIINSVFNFVFDGFWSFLLTVLFSMMGYTYLKKWYFSWVEEQKQRQKEEQVRSRVEHDILRKKVAISYLVNGIDGILKKIASDEQITRESSILATSKQAIDSFYFAWKDEYDQLFDLSMTRVVLTGIHDRTPFYELPDVLSSFLNKNVK